MDGTTDGKRHPNSPKSPEVPGPGSYPIQDVNNGPFYTMGYREHPKCPELKVKKKIIYPGVGSYELRKDDSFIVPCFKFDKQERNDLTINTDSLKFPGAKYKMNMLTCSSSTPKWSFSKSERFPHYSQSVKKSNSKQNLGPGSYKTQEFVGNEGPFISFSKIEENHELLDKDELKKSKEFPNCATYNQNLNYQPSSPFYSFANIKPRTENYNKSLLKNPGPDKYNPKNEYLSTVNKSPLWSWSLSKTNRDENADVEGSKKRKIVEPGPGSYTNKIGNIPQGPKYSMREMSKKVKIIEFPGPGSYNAKDNNKSKNPVYSISPCGREDELKQVKKDNYPGPGSYKIKDVNLAKDITFPKNEKIYTVKFSVPGPGAYKIPSSFDYINSMARDGGAFDPRFRYV